MATVTFITNVGKAITTARLLGTGTEPKYADWGTGATVATATDTALQTPAGEARTTGTSSQATRSTTNDTYRVIATIVATATRAIKEAGLFDAITTGQCFLHTSFDVINLDVNDSITFTFDAQYQ